MIELLQDHLQEWRTKEEVLTYLRYLNYISEDHHFKVSERQFRLDKEKWNDRYFNHEVDMCLVHSNTKGYKLTNDPKEIIEMETDFIKRAKDMFVKAYHIKQARIENNNYSFEDFLEEQKSPLIEATN